MIVKLPGTGTLVDIQTLADFGGDRSAWVNYLNRISAYIGPLYNSVLWMDGEEVPESRKAYARALRTDADFWQGLTLRAISGDVNLPTSIEQSIPAALDTPPPRNENINPLTNVYTAASQSPPMAQINGGNYVRYRFIMGPNVHPPSTKPVYDTGANLSTCNRSNPSGCDPQQFASIADVLKYAQDHGETVVKVPDAMTAFNIIEGKAVVSPDMLVTSASDAGGIGILTILGLAATLFKHKAS